MSNLTNRSRFAVLGVGLCVLAACSSGPATKDQVCADYDTLASAVVKGNGFGNPVFVAAKDLADTASRYSPQEQLASDAKSLQAIGESGSTSAGDLEDATRSIAALCGAAPLTIQGLTQQ